MDIAHAYTDEELQKLERKFRKIYRQAADEMYEKLEIYLNSLAAKDAAMLTKLSNGKITSKQYQAWRAQQILVGEQMETMAADLAKSCTDANIMALKALNADLSDVFAENANYIMYAAEMVTGENYAFTLYNQNAVNRLIKDNPQLLPKPRVKIAKDRKWNQRVITSAVTQGILQGESMPNIAKRMHGEVSKGITVESIKNANRMTAEQVAKAVERRIMVAAMRTARTAVTGAENAGRLQGYKDLQSNGVDIKQQWVATLDNRTRHEHRMLDGQIREIGEPFEVDGYKLDFPADPKGEAHLVYNCRCTTISVINGHEVDIDVRDKSVIGDYEEWKNGKKEELGGVKEWERLPKRPRKYDYDDTEEFEKARRNYRKTRDRLNAARDEQIERDIARERVIKTHDDFEKWAKANSINLTNMSREIDPLVLDDVAHVQGEMLRKYPQIKAWQDRYYPYQIGFNNDPDYMFEAHCGLVFGSMWKDYRYGMESVYDAFRDGYLTNGDGTIRSVLRHEFGHMVDGYIRDIQFNTLELNALRDKEELAKRRSMQTKYEKELIDLTKKYCKTEYAYTNTAEAFAEGFAEHTSNPNSDYGKAFGAFLKRWL